MAIEKIRMPKVNQGMDEVNLWSWAVAQGDRVNKGDVLCCVETT